MAPNSETTDVKSWHESGAVHIHLFFPLWMTECKNECYSVSLQTLNFVHADIPLLLSWTALSANLFSHFHRWDCSTTFLPNCIFLPSAFCHGVPLSPLHFYFHPPPFPQFNWNLDFCHDGILLPTFSNRSHSSFLLMGWEEGIPFLNAANYTQQFHYLLFWSLPFTYASLSPPFPPDFSP